MKVIYRGTPPGDVIWSGKCHTCKSVMEAPAIELKITHEPRDGPFATAKCPVCNADFHLYPKQKQ